MGSGSQGSRRGYGDEGGGYEPRSWPRCRGRRVTIARERVAEVKECVPCCPTFLTRLIESNVGCNRCARLTHTFDCYSDANCALVNVSLTGKRTEYRR